MKIISMNIYGFGGLTKQKSLSPLVSRFNFDMILLQETICNFSHALLVFSKFKRGWELCAIDAFSLSGGLLAGWNPLLVHCKGFSSFAGIILQASIKGITEILSIFNYYVPYSQ